MRARFLAAIGFALLSACVPESSRSAVSAAGAAVDFEGDMTRPKVEAALAELDRTKATAVRVTSNGGAAANFFADELRRRNVTVIVADYCVALCAQSVFLAAKRRVVEGRAFVAFHNDVVAGNIIIRRTGGKPEPKIDEISAGDVSSYERWGLNYRLLLDQFLGLDPYCWWVRPAPNAKMTGGALMNADLWVPTRAWVEKTAGAKFEGWWPANQSEALAAGRRAFPKERVRYGAPIAAGAFFEKAEKNSCAALQVKRL